MRLDSYPEFTDSRILKKRAAMSCRRKGGGSSSAGGSGGGSFAVSDVDDRALSAMAQERAAKKAVAERSNSLSSAPAAPFPWAFFVPAVLFVVAAMYLTFKFS
jgi:hypothetical protein